MKNSQSLPLYTYMSMYLFAAMFRRPNKRMLSNSSITTQVDSSIRTVSMYL